MIYHFNGYQLDPRRIELRSNEESVPVEPQVFALLELLVSKRERLVSKDEIVEKIWGGRIISDAAISSRVRSARSAIGDNGCEQALIRTIRGQGFRFVGDVKVSAAATKSKPDLEAASARSHLNRPSIAVLPFELIGEGGAYSVIADALPADLINSLVRLRWLAVIARVSSFRLRGEEQTPARVRDSLAVRYSVSGQIEMVGEKMHISVELNDLHRDCVLWTEQFKAETRAIFEIRDHIVQRAIGAIEHEIQNNEAQLAKLQTPDSLDAWAAYHLGLSRAYRFTRDDNAAAESHFNHALARSPEFAKAYAGLSFTHFQNAFLRYSNNFDEESRLALDYAEKCLNFDNADSFGHLTKGRFFWLSGDLEAGRVWLDRAIELNPNYAHAHYSQAWVQALLGESVESDENIETALVLSPLDPLRYAMLAVRGFSQMVRGDFSDAAIWAEQAASSPGAHALIEMSAVVAHTLSGNNADADRWARSVASKAPDFDRADFLRAFPFREMELRNDIVAALKSHAF